MTQTTRVDFHCHSVFSDGALDPEALADQLAADGVLYAALTDHDAVEGLESFRQAATRRGIGCVSGVELTVRMGPQEAHLLAYGFDPTHPELLATLVAQRQARPPAAHSVTDAVRARAASSPPASRPPAPPGGAAPNGRLDIADAIALIHRAGGKAFLAHPLTVETDFDRLARVVAALREEGLDGIEVHYGPYPPDVRERLARIARENGLIASAGSDGHHRPLPGAPPFGVDVPSDCWKALRDAVVRPLGDPSADRPASEAPAHARPRPRFRYVMARIVAPTVLVMALFLVAIFAVFLPAFQRSLLERKREMIRELTNSAWSVLESAERDETAGLFTREEAQRLAASRIEILRYGPDRKDYFWLQDTTPRMVMHPYRPELNGQDLTSFEDPRGERVFVRFAEMVLERGEGYVDYYWQWKDDPSRLEPKESFVKAFEPWGWIIGTGIYIEDVQRETARVERSLVLTSLAIAAVVLLLSHVVRQSLRLERDRSAAEEALRASRERYRSLVEATTEGVLMVVDGRCRYANPFLLQTLDRSRQELPFLDLEDVLPRTDENRAAWDAIDALPEGGAAEAVVRRRDGAPVDAAVAVSPAAAAGMDGVILLIKPLGRTERLSAASGGGPLPPETADAAGVGLFRARATSGATVLHANTEAQRLLRVAGRGGDPLTVASLFPDPAAWGDFLAEVNREGSAERTVHSHSPDGQPLALALRAALVTTEGTDRGLMDCALEDVTARTRDEAERAALIERLQSSLLFLHEPIREIAREGVRCALDTPVRMVAARMTADRTSVALVTSEDGSVIGLFTDHDLRERVVASGADLLSPVYRFMSAPVLTISDDAGVYEGLMAMDEHGVRRLAVVDHEGRITGVIRERQLLQFPSYGPIVLEREIARAESPEAVAASCRRAPALARALFDSGARPQRVTRMLTSIRDAAATRLAAFAEADLGPPPTPYAFLALGSHGRQETVLSSDQDSALIYEDPPEPRAEVDAYFRDLGQLLADWLHEAGCPRCNGGMTAANPRWRQPLSAWRRCFAEWIAKADAREVLEFSVFFDLRPVCGDPELARALRDHIDEELGGHPGFLLQLARPIVEYRPPFRLFGRLPAGSLSVKEALAPLVSFARLYALRQGLRQTHTRDRLVALAEAGVLNPASRDATLDAYDALMRLRLQRQVHGSAEEGASPDLVDYHSLGSVDAMLVDQAFSQIVALQKRVSHDFLGDSPGA